MEFLKEGTELCPYCKQPLTESKDRYYCNTESCNKVFEKYTFRKEDV